MAHRSLNEYRRYLHGERDRPAPIPPRTWRRWLDQGKITVMQLLEMGIHPGQRRKLGAGRKMKQVASLNADLPGPSEEPVELLLPDEAAEDVSSTFSMDRSDHDSDATTASRNGAGYWLGGIDDCSSAPSDIDIGEDTSDESDSDLDSARVSSVLDSKRIGMEALNSAFFEGSRLSKFEVMLMIFHLVMRHGCTDALLEDLISYSNEIAGVPNAIPGSKFLFQKLFKFGSQPSVHFFCPNCQKYLGPQPQFQKEVECQDCDWSKSSSSLNDNNYFLTLPIRSQLKEVLSRPDLKFVSKDVPTAHVADISHGLLYKAMGKNAEFSHPDRLTITMSTDGSPVFKNGPNTLYPVHFHLNEIAPEHRFDVENMLLAGLWFSKRGDPDLQIFFKPIVDELLGLQTEGILWRNPNGVIVRSPVFLTCICADSVARPKVQNFVQFNSAYGCSYCMHPNTSIVVTESLKKGHGIRRGLVGSDSNSDSDEQGQSDVILTKTKQMKRYVVGTHYPLRSHAEMRKHMELAESSGLEHFYGAKGRNVLSPLQFFDSVFGFPIDYMHSVLLGLTKRLANLWFDSENHKKPYYIGTKVDLVNRRLAQISLPSNMPRPRPMSWRSNWKAKEWGGFLLYYGLPSLVGVLPEKYYNHFRSLSTAIFILNKESVSFDEGVEAEELLKDFVYDYQTLYEEKNMVYNVHLASHLGRMVAFMGPLWNYSLFHFEGANGRLVKLVKGTRGVATQIARKYLMSHSVSKLLRGDMYRVQDSVLNFCSKVIEYKYCKSSCKFEDIRLIGRSVLIQLEDYQQEVLENSGCHIQRVCKVYNRAYFNKTTISSRALRRQKTSNDSCVRLQGGSFVIIDYIIAEDEQSEVWCLGTEINIAMDAFLQMPPHIKECAIDALGSLVAFPFNWIEERCVFISIEDDKHYVAQVPNTFEKN